MESPMECSMVTPMDCDVLVVGAGPTGATFAVEAAKRGLNTLVVERKFQIASPTRGGEAVSKSHYDELANTIKVLKEVPKWEMNGGSLSTGKIRVVNSGEKWEAYALERKVFEKKLVENAILEGASIMLGTEMKNVKSSEKGVSEVVVERFGKKIKVRANVIVDAGGFASTLRKKYSKELGIKTDDWGNAIEFEVDNANLENTNLLQLFIGETIPGGYAYVFPKGGKRADVGVGVRPYFGGIAAIDVFERVLRDNKTIYEQIKDSQQIEIRGGGIDVGGPTKNLVRGNIVTIGDAANQNFCDVGEGIPPGMLGAMIAAKKIAVNTESLEEEFSTYEDEYYDTEIGRDVIKTMRIKNRLNYILSLDIAPAIKFGIMALLKMDVLDNKDEDVSRAVKCRGIYDLIEVGRNCIESKKLKAEITAE